MGAVHFSIDPDLATLLVSGLASKVFIETGTFKGDTVALMRPLFEKLHTCELSPELHAAAVQRFENDPAICCHYGSSPEDLGRLALTYEKQSILYWLDAHWCSADHTAGCDSQCPLLEELEAIAPLHPDSVVWIDDARYFMAPPPAPLVSQGWPSFQQVLDRLQALSSEHRLIFANDTILFFPSRIEHEIEHYLRQHGADWLAISLAAQAFQKAIKDRQKTRKPSLRKRLVKWLKFRSFRRWIERVGSRFTS